MALILLLVMLVAGLFDLFKGRFLDATILLGFVGLVGGVLQYMRQERQKGLDFLLWLQANRQSIEKGWAYYESQKITLNTVLTQYQACISLLLLTLRFRSPRLIVGSQEAQNKGAVYTVVAILFGWWGLPWGFVYTPQAIYRNVKGGYQQTVKELLPKLEAEIAHNQKKMGTRRSEAPQPTFASAIK